jgi:hypothetical protein
MSMHIQESQQKPQITDDNDRTSTYCGSQTVGMQTFSRFEVHLSQLALLLCNYGLIVERILIICPGRREEEFKVGLQHILLW